MFKMDRLIQVFMTLALVATALAAPGPMFGSLFQRPGDRTTFPFQPPSTSTSISTSSSESEISSRQFPPPSFSTSFSTSTSSSEQQSSLQFRPPFATSTSSSSSGSEPSSFQFQPPFSTSTSSSESEPTLFQFQFQPPFSTSTSESESEPSSFQFQPPFSTPTSTSSSESEPSSASFSSSSSSFALELREEMPKSIMKSKPSPSDSRCTAGDRKCHASLDYILFCNDDNQWLSYSGCQDGTFCHRLHMICVAEVVDPTAVSIAAPTSAFPSHTHGVRDTSPQQCKEGDRRCSLLFNRVDRCNNDYDWVTYHNCRKSEMCDESTLECLPRISYGSNGSMPHGPLKSNRTGTI
ncbi:hypothetical protein F5X97DRAFT_231175 [Nemania serpens]|nr:hypothetical protein F5X97DRAFT_231175 [Nemania serpens]